MTTGNRFCRTAILLLCVGGFLPAATGRAEGIMPAAPTSLTFPLDRAESVQPASGASARGNAPAATLDAIEWHPVPGGLVIDLRGNGALEYTSFLLQDPARLVLDLPGVFNRTNRKAIPVGRDGVSQIRIAQNRPQPEPLTRVVFDLEAGPSTSVVRDETGVHVFVSTSGEAEVNRLAGASASRHAAPIVRAGVPLEEAAADRIARGALHGNDIRFDAPVRASTGDLFETADAVAQNAEAANFIRTFETRQFTGVESQYTGIPLTVDFRDAPILDIFRLFHELTGLNIVVDSSIKTQTITIDVVDVPWDQILDLILKSNSLGKTLDNNVLRIAPTSRLTQEENERQQLRQQRELSGDLVTVSRTLSYAKATGINSVIRRFMSPRGEVIVDDRTNTIFLKDLKDYLETAKAVLESLDVAQKQVMIEARIVETQKSFSQAFGIQWGFNYLANRQFGNTTNYAFPHFISLGGNRVPSTGGISLPLGGYAVNLPVPGFNSGIGISLANILNTFQLDIALTALEQKGKARIISAPKVVAQNNEQAVIESGVQIPIVNTTATEIDVRFVSASLRLQVTPQITADGTVIMELVVENNSPSQTVAVGGGIPAITTRRATTTVLVRDGGTTVIGGIYQVNESVSQSRTPFLHRVPLLGWLFKNHSKRIDNNELLIFLTPRILT